MWLLNFWIGYLVVAVAAALFLGQFFNVTDPQAEAGLGFHEGDPDEADLGGVALLEDHEAQVPPDFFYPIPEAERRSWARP
jgi:hypothetical protein